MLTLRKSDELEQSAEWRSPLLTLQFPGSTPPRRHHSLNLLGDTAPNSSTKLKSFVGIAHPILLLAAEVAALPQLISPLTTQ